VTAEQSKNSMEGNNINNNNNSGEGYMTYTENGKPESRLGGTLVKQMDCLVLAASLDGDEELVDHLEWDQRGGLLFSFDHQSV